jgi:hypothetical protein
MLVPENGRDQAREKRSRKGIGDILTRDIDLVQGCRERVAAPAWYLALFLAEPCRSIRRP